MSSISYQSLREQLISLTVELDDRTKLAEVLTEKVEEIRIDLQRLERDYERRYTQLIEDEMAKYSQTSQELTEKNDQAIKRKKDLIEECKALVDELKRQDEDLSSTLRNLHTKTLRDIESDRKLFRIHADERQKKFLAAKQKEILETTERALEPEYSRLRVANEQEISDLETRLAAEEKKTLQDLEKQFEEKVLLEEKMLRENQRNMARVQLDETMREVERMEREHKLRMDALTDEYLREGEKYKHSLSLKAKKESENQENNLREIELKSREKINELKNRHESDIRALESDHVSKVRGLQQQYAKKKRDYESGALPNRHGRNHEECDDTSLEGLRKSLTARYTDAEKLLYEKLKKESTEMKSKHIKAEIRKLHIETSVLEKEIRDKTDLELKRIQDAAESEESHLRKRQELLVKEMADLSAEKSSMLGELKRLTDEYSGYYHRIRETKSKANEKQAIQSKLTEKKSELQRHYDSKMKELVNVNDVLAIDLKNMMNDFITEREKNKRENERQLVKMEEEHEMTLNHMNETVRNEVAKRDEEKDVLLDALQTEKVRYNKLKKMLQKYNSNV